MSWEPEVGELRQRQALAREMGGADKVARQHKAGRLTVRERIAALLDAGSFNELGSITGAAAYDETGALQAMVPTNFLFGRGLEPFASDFSLDTGVGPDNRDLVVDFRQGQDVLDLSGYRNIFTGPGGPASLFLGTDPFAASTALQVRYDIVGGNTVVQFVAPLGASPAIFPPPTPGAPDGEIALAGIHHLAASDFILP